jgi:hypothetical protein
MSNEQRTSSKPRYLWPWFLLGAVVLGVVLALIWLTAEVRRVRDQRQPDFTSPATTNAASAPGPAQDSVNRFGGKR